MSSVKSLKILIKLRKKSLDDIMLVKNIMEKDKQNKINEIKAKNKELVKEFDAYVNSQFGIYFANFKKNTEQNIQKLTLDINSLNQKIEMFDSRIRELFAEIKRFEIVMDKRKLEEHKKQSYAEMKSIDELNNIKEANRKMSQV